MMKITACCWLLVGFLPSVYSQKLTIEPQVIQLGIERRLSAKCFYKADTRAIAKLSTLRILFSADTVRPDFEAVASTDAELGTERSTPAETRGAVVRDGASWLNLTWAYPFNERTGIYRCVAKGLNKAGEFRTDQTSVMVTAIEPPTKVLLDAFQKQLVEIDQLKQEKSAWDRKLEHMRNVTFEQSDVFKGHRYFLSPIQYSITGKESEAVCEFFGGYLAEYDTEEEFQFIRSFLSKFTTYGSVMSAGTDEISENAWISLYSNLPLKMIKWGKKKPNGGDTQNCLFFLKASDWAVDDLSCNLHSENYGQGYLCEVPLNEA